MYSSKVRPQKIFSNINQTWLTHCCIYACPQFKWNIYNLNVLQSGHQKFLCSSLTALPFPSSPSNNRDEWQAQEHFIPSDDGQQRWPWTHWPRLPSTCLPTQWLAGVSGNSTLSYQRRKNLPAQSPLSRQSALLPNWQATWWLLI